MVDDGNVPQSLQKPLKALESRGNPYGKMEKKSADWAKAKEFQQTCHGQDSGRRSDGADTLYFVDSITSYDDRMQSIGRATARILEHVGANFGILGAAEKDSGHEVRRFGEEMLFHGLAGAQHRGHQSLRGAADRHRRPARLQRPEARLQRCAAGGAHQPGDRPRGEGGKIKLNPVENGGHVYTYHDPCYLGRHNQVYDEPREVLDAIPGLKRVEMSRCRDRSFCCGGGGLMLFYEPKEDQRMGVVRVKMAAEAGANVIVTACPFCMVNIEDAIKVAGMEGKMTAIDLTELVDQQMVRESAVSGSGQLQSTD